MITTYSQQTTNNEPLPHMPKSNAPGTKASTMNITQAARVTVADPTSEERETNFLFFKTAKNTKPKMDKNQLVEMTIPAKADTAFPPRKWAYNGQQWPSAAPKEAK